MVVALPVGLIDKLKQQFNNPENVFVMEKTDVVTHHPHLNTVLDEFKEFLDTISFHVPNKIVIANSTGDLLYIICI